MTTKNKRSDHTPKDRNKLWKRFYVSKGKALKMMDNSLFSTEGTGFTFIQNAYPSPFMPTIWLI